MHVFFGDFLSRCRSSSSCSAFWIDYTSASCFRLGNPKFTDANVQVDFSKASSYFERLCLQGKTDSKIPKNSQKRSHNFSHFWVQVIFAAKPG